MIKPDELIAEAVSLPVEIRTKLVEQLLESLNPSLEEFDKLWEEEAERRVEELERGDIKAIPGEEVVSKIKKRLKG